MFFRGNSILICLFSVSQTYATVHTMSGESSLISIVVCLILGEKGTEEKKNQTPISCLGNFQEKREIVANIKPQLSFRYQTSSHVFAYTFKKPDRVGRWGSMLENFLFKNMSPPTHIFHIIHHAELSAYCKFAKNEAVLMLIIISDLCICDIQSKHFSIPCC